jgi:hypothetical protein
MLAGWVRWDDGLSAAFAEPMTQAGSIIGRIGEQPPWGRHRGQEAVRHGKIIGVAGRELESDRPAVIVGQRMDFGRASPARAADGIAEGPPFAPAAERWAFTWVESMAIVPMLPVEPVNA